jgi:protein-tyrosine-phosphatase
MDSDNHANVLSIAGPKHHQKVFYLRDFDLSDQAREVPDPYGQSDDAFESVLGMVERSIDGLLIALGVVDPSDTSR